MSQTLGYQGAVILSQPTAAVLLDIYHVPLAVQSQVIPGMLVYMSQSRHGFH
jgi:hypothetical protein